MCGFKIGIAHSIPILMNPNPIPTQIYTIPTPNPIPLHMNTNPESNPDSDSSFDSDSGFGIAPGLWHVRGIISIVVSSEQACTLSASFSGSLWNLN